MFSTFAHATCEQIEQEEQSVEKCWRKWKNIHSRQGKAWIWLIKIRPHSNLYFQAFTDINFVLYFAYVKNKAWQQKQKLFLKN